MAVFRVLSGMGSFSLITFHHLSFHRTLTSRHLSSSLKSRPLQKLVKMVERYLLHLLFCDSRPLAPLVSSRRSFPSPFQNSKKNRKLKTMKY
ncbi:hypothetical protein L1887_37123 [Cichorium endivia]|nr:hypothetical protein L1887_37123 [Cichorium endivia]